MKMVVSKMTVCTLAVGCPAESHWANCATNERFTKADLDGAVTREREALRAISSYCGEYLEPERVRVMPKPEDIAGHCKLIADAAIRKGDLIEYAS